MFKNRRDIKALTERVAALEVRIGALIKLNAAVLGTEGANRISEKDFSEGELAELRGE